MNAAVTRLWRAIAVSRPDRIDVHHHIVPPGYGDWLRSRGVGVNGPPLPVWSSTEALAVMDRQGIRSAVLSLSTPGVHPGEPDEAGAKAREINEYTAEVVARHPGRFGFFATLTLPDVEGAIAEAIYALDELHADGVVLLANTRGVYLGDAAADPLFAELDKRSAVVFVHPSELPAPPVPGVPPVAADYLLDTTRAALSLIASGTLERCPSLKVIIPHGGGFLPYIAFRAAPILAGGGDPASALAALRRFYFDTGLSTTPAALPSLLAFSDPQHLLYGSDWPYAPEPFLEYFSALFADYPLEAAERERMDHGNAATLFPQLAKDG